MLKSQWNNKKQLLSHWTDLFQNLVPEISISQHFKTENIFTFCHLYTGCPNKSDRALTEITLETFGLGYYFKYLWKAATCNYLAK